MPREASAGIYGLAADQLGYFTTAQASASGVHPMAVVMMQRRGTVERISYGVYRLVHFPVSPLAQYMEASLWPRGAVGVVSHESALALYEISDVNPSRIHITIPASLRIRRAIPRHIAVHKADIKEQEIECVDGIPVTSPVRTIFDCHAANLGPALIGQAINDGRKSGHLTNKQADHLEDALLGRSQIRVG